ncbi:hypothetical protein VTO73DRAFT_10806 [Trametes versicolor]
MPRRLPQLRQVSKTLAAKLRPVWLGRGIHSLGRGISRIPIAPVIAVVETAGNVGSSFSIVQGISSVTVTLLQRAQAVGRNRKECKELALLAESVTSAVVDATSDVQEELDEKMLLHLAELEWRMAQIADTMTRLERKPTWRRFWRKDKHEDALIEHKKSLEHALRIFQMKEIVSGRCAQRREHRQIIEALHAAGFQSNPAPVYELSVGGKSGTAFFFDKRS